MALTVGDYRARARFLWPRLDPDRLRRTRGDPERILTLVAARSSLPREELRAMLLGASDVAASEDPPDPDTSARH
jgi:hypothetical protein